MKINKNKILSLIIVVAMLVSVLPFAAVTASAAAPATFTDIALGEANPVSSSSSSDETYFRFIPTVTGTYRFYSTNLSGDSHGNLYDADGNLLLSDDDGMGNLNFRIQTTLTAGVTYYLGAKAHGSNTATFDAVIEGVNLPTPPPVVDGPGVYNLFNSGRTGSPGDSYIDHASFSNGGYDIYAGSLQTVRLGLSFTVNAPITERASLTINANDVDESQGERDFIYLVDETDSSRDRIPGYLSGRNGQWNTTTMYVDPTLFEVGHTYHYELTETVSGWVVYVRTVSMQIGNTEIVSHDFTASIDANGLVSTSLYLQSNADRTYYIEYAASHGGDQLGSLLGETMEVTTLGTTKTASFNLEAGTPGGTYVIDVYVKDSFGNMVATYSINSAYAPHATNYIAVNYDSNGGNTNIPIDTSSYVEGDNITVLFDYVPARADHTFLGWATDSSATVPEFVDGGANTIVAGTDDITFYAVWQSNVVSEGVRIDSASDTMVLYPDTSFYQTMDFYVVVDGLAPVDSIAVVPSFDSSVLEFVSSEWLMTADLQSIEAGTLRSVSAWNGATDINGNVYKITLRAIAETASTTVGATVMVQDDDGLRTLPVVAKNITITSCSHASFTITTHDGAQHIATCDVCGYNELRAHNENATWETDGVNHWHTCVDCGSVIDSTVAAHTPDTAWVSDGVNHWHTCTECNAVVDSTVTAHTPDAAWTSDGTNHWHTCTECGTVVDSTFSAHNPDGVWVSDGANHWQLCTDCGAIVDSTVASHVEGTEWQSDDDNHWHLCDVCATALVSAPHEYDNATDPTCNVCDHIRVMRGDTDGDFDIDSDDAVLALLHMFYPDLYTVNQDLDFNGDGQENSDDATHLLQHAFYPALYPLSDFRR